MAGLVELGILLMAKDEASKVLEHAQGKAEGFGGAIGAMAGPLLAAGAAAVGLAGTLVGFAESTANAELNVRKLARETGLTTEAASELRYAGERLNIDTDQLSKSFGIFSKNLESAHPKLEQYHIAVAKTSDGHIDMTRTLGNIADRFAKMPDGVEKTAIALNLFGKSGKDMIPLLNEGSAGLRAQAEEAAKLGLVFSKDGVEAAFKMQQAQKDLEERFESVKNKIGVAVVPVLTTVFGILVNAADTVIPPFVDAIGKVWAIFTEVFDVLTGRAPSAGAALTGALGPGMASSIMGAIAGIREAISAVIDTIGQFITWLNSSDDAATAIRTVLGYLAEVVGTTLNIALQIVGGAFRALGDVVRGIGPLFKELGQIVAIVQDSFKMLTAIGADLVAGLIRGITGAWDGLMRFIKEKIDLIPEGIRKFLGISSPSTVMAEIGQQMTAGLAVGIAAGSPAVQAAASAVVAAAGARFMDPAKTGGSVWSASGVLSGNYDWSNHGDSRPDVRADRAEDQRLAAMPHFDAGGVMPYTGVAHLLAGEVVSKPGSVGGMPAITNNFYGPIYGMADLDTKIRQVIRDAVLGGGFRGVLAPAR